MFKFEPFDAIELTLLLLGVQIVLGSCKRMFFSLGDTS